MDSTSTPLDGIIFGSCAALGVVVTALCAYRAQRKSTVANWCISFAFGICTVGVFFAIPSIAQWAESVTGIDNIAKLVAHICAILWCVFLQLAMVDIAYAPAFLRVAIARRAFVALAVLAAMIPMWLSANQPGIDFTTAFASNVPVRIYLITYLFYVFFTCSELAFMCGKSATYNWPGRPWSSFGYASSAVAAVLGILYAASRGGYLIAYTMETPWSLHLEEKMSPALAGLAVIFLFLGLTLPLIGTLIREYRRRSTSQLES
ncbi:hypothetical protein [Streptomyces sp. NPDC059761]|uniref:hypothetical protein n=1 Tax=Streptomyces sp. NPDC059761 TaxID=3346937 RepID=UPI003652E237